MAKIVQGRNGKWTKVIWQEDTNDGRTSRSRQLDTEANAQLYKALVEVAGDENPSYVTLERHGLTKFGYPINPNYIMGLRRIAFSDDFTAEEKINFIKQQLKDF